MTAVETLMQAEIDRLRAELAGMRKSAALRVQFHAAELADVTAELANAKASGIHSCHDGCTRSGCVAGRLTAERDGLRADADRYRWLRRSQVALSLPAITVAALVADQSQLDAARDET